MQTLSEIYEIKNLKFEHNKKENDEYYVLIKEMKD